jgi:hypothetical protein
MIRNKLYDELEKEGYSFHRTGRGGQLSPEVFSLTDLDDWARVDPTITINGQYQVERGTNCSQKTVQMLQRVLEETFRPDYYDFISKNCLKDGE